MTESMNLKDLKNSNLLTAIYIDNLDRIEVISETIFSIAKQTYKPDFIVLYSPHLNEEDIKTLTSKLESPSIIVRKKDAETQKLVEETLQAEEKINFKLVPFQTDRFSKIFNHAFNLAVDNGYELFNIIEGEDVVGLNWYKTVDQYTKENEDIDAFVPIVRNSINGVFSGLLNEASWAEGMAEEAGKLDMTLLTRFNCIIPVGTVFKVNSLKEYAEEKDDEKLYPFKESVKLTGYYEFFLRMVYNDLKIMTIPRIGYEMRLNLNNKYSEISCKIPQNITAIPVEFGGYTQEEASFWMDLAKKEYFFDDDREKTYEPTGQ